MLVVATGAAAIAPERVAAIAVRTLGYDRGLTRRAGTRVDLLVLCATAQAAACRSAFAPLEGIKVQGIPLAVVVAAPDAASLAALLATHKPDAVFASGRQDLVVSLAALAPAAPFVLLADGRAAMAAGAHLAIVEVAGKPKLVVSPTAAKRATIYFGAELLALAELYP